MHQPVLCFTSWISLPGLHSARGRKDYRKRGWDSQFYFLHKFSHVKSASCHLGQFQPWVLGCALGCDSSSSTISVVVYFDQLSGAARTRKLVKILFWPVLNQILVIWTNVETSTNSANEVQLSITKQHQLRTVNQHLAVNQDLRVAPKCWKTSFCEFFYFFCLWQKKTETCLNTGKDDFNLGMACRANLVQSTRLLFKKIA